MPEVCDDDKYSKKMSKQLIIMEKFGHKTEEIKFNWLNKVNGSTRIRLLCIRILDCIRFNILLGRCTIRNNACAQVFAVGV